MCAECDRGISQSEQRRHPGRSRGADEGWIPSVSAIAGLFWTMIPCRQRVHWACCSPTEPQLPCTSREKQVWIPHHYHVHMWQRELWSHIQYVKNMTRMHTQTSGSTSSAVAVGFEVNVFRYIYKWGWDFSEIITCCYTSLAILPN